MGGPNARENQARDRRRAAYATGVRDERTQLDGRGDRTGGHRRMGGRRRSHGQRTDTG